MSGFAQRVLVLFAHPALEVSAVNRLLVEVPLAVEGVTFRDLYELYPAFEIDVSEEQRLLVEHDVILFHHPLYWYSIPPLLRQWQDLVLEHDWAYGSKGIHLRGKAACHVITAGGPADTYSAGGHNRYHLRDFLRPLEGTAVLCGMDYLPPFVVYGTHGLDPMHLERHVADYRRLLVAFRDGTFDRGRARSVDRLNTDLGGLIAPATAASMGGD